MLAIAHRGASGYAPENTFAAFRRAVAQGVSFIETDLHLTRDAHFVAIHDETVERTTNELHASSFCRFTVLPYTPRIPSRPRGEFCIPSACRTQSSVPRTANR